MDGHRHLSKGEVEGLRTGKHEWGRQRLAEVNNRYGSCNECRASVDQASRDHAAAQALSHQPSRL